MNQGTTQLNEANSMSMGVPLSARTLLSKSWDLFKQYWMHVYVLIMIPFVSGMIQELLSTFLGAEDFMDLNSIIITAAFFILNIVIGIAVTRALIALARSQTIDFSIDRITQATDVFVPTLVSSLIIGIMTVLGFIFFIIPGIYIMLRYLFVPYLIADKRMTVSEAMQASTLMTQGVKLKLFWILFVTGIVSMSGILLFFVGLLITIPMIMFVMPLLYDQRLYLIEDTVENAVA